MYKLVFESNLDLSYFNTVNIIGIVFSILVFLVLWQYHKYKKIKKFMFILLVIFIIVHIDGIIDFYQTKKKISDAFKNKSFNIVEGYVENFHAMSKGGHDIEKFDVNGTHFEILYTGNYSGTKTLFYTLTKNRNGYIQNNGDKVKIYYITDNGKNKIIKMWILKK